MFEALLSNRTVSVLVEALPRILTAGLTMTIPLTLLSFFFAMIIAVAVALVPLGIVGSEYMPRTDESAIQVNIELPTGFNADQTNEALLLFEDYLAKVPEIEHYMTNVTTTQSMGKLVIALKSSDERSKDVWQVAQGILAKSRCASMRFSHPLPVFRAVATLCARRYRWSLRAAIWTSLWLIPLRWSRFLLRLQV